MAIDLCEGFGGGVLRRTTLITWDRLAVFAAGATFTLAACSQEPTTSPAPTTTTTTTSASPTSPASTVDKAKQDALTAYRSMWQDFVIAGATSDWQSTNLGQHATGVALTNLTRGLHQDNTNGLVTKGEPKLDPSVSSVEPQNSPVKIVVTDCGDSTNWLKYRKDNGQLADDKPGGRHRINAIVEKQADGIWKVSDYGVHDVGTC